MKPLCMLKKPEDHEDIKSLLIRNWQEGRSETGETFRSLIGEELHGQVAEWLESLNARNAFRILRAHDLRYKRLPASWPDEWRESFTIWRNAQYALEASERGEQTIVKGKEAEAAAMFTDWKKFVSEEDVARIFGGQADA